MTIAPVALLVLNSCAITARSGRDVEGKTYQVNYRENEPKVTQHVDASVAETWSVLGPAFQDLNYKGGPAENGEHLYMTPTMRLTGRLYEGEWNSAYFDCGRTPLGVPAAESYELAFAVLVWVDADKPSGSSVKVLVNGWGHDRANPSAVVACTGTGRLEAMFTQAIQRRLKLAANANGRL